MPLRKTVS